MARALVDAACKFEAEAKDYVTHVSSPDGISNLLRFPHVAPSQAPGKGAPTQPKQYLGQPGDQFFGPLFPRLRNNVLRDPDNRRVCAIIATVFSSKGARVGQALYATSAVSGVSRVARDTDIAGGGESRLGADVGGVA